MRMAHMAAMVNPRIRGAMIDAAEFPDYSREHSVYAVPKTIIKVGDHVHSFEGRVPESMFISALRQAVQHHQH
ncbi:hypothetical protein caldi_17710 [Caldinitratiruptor microaerophilus]|uniref:Thioredoxin-like fold domain-containing protein n=1 Tax=Caldinitratiruptor microaerophilus TaxID=671077 RepID=A0AA35G837_9FIRM|nr:hypothetical protein caldi_17710 [Caldinitratiruptor microaerophilus]